MTANDLYFGYDLRNKGQGQIDLKFCLKTSSQTPIPPFDEVTHILHNDCYDVWTTTIVSDCQYYVRIKRQGQIYLNLSYC